MRRTFLLGGLGLGLLGATACTATSVTPRAADARRIDEALRDHRVVLFGEVHDNPEGHAARAAALERLLAAGARPALVMEHFDVERQAQIDRLQAEAGTTAGALVAAAGGGGWPWPQLTPVVALALQYRLPIVAANLSRDAARRVMRDGAAAAGLAEREVPADVEQAQAEAIVAGHCGQIDATVAAPMVRAQVARDRTMATLLERHLDRGAVLLAGNGHVRRDVGVPRWLGAAALGQSVVIGTVEDASPAPAFDLVVRVRAPARDDPCAALRSAPPRLRT